MIGTKLRLVNKADALNILRAGGVLIYPTETSYAIGCDATNEAAVARVFAIKGRPSGKGLPVILPANLRPAAFIEFSETARELSQEHWSGPFNIVAKRASDSTISTLCETNGSQSVRKSSHRVASELASSLGRPIVATSANRSGNDSLFTKKAILAEFSQGEMPDGFLDAGDLPEAEPSTTVFIAGNDVRVIRQGSVQI